MYNFGRDFIKYAAKQGIFARDFGLGLRKTLFYFGVPVNVNSKNSVKGAADFFANYDVVAFNAGLEDISNPDHDTTVDIIKQIRTSKPHIEIFGRINLNATAANLGAIKAKVLNWKKQGFASGILFDNLETNPDRDTQNQVIDYIHENNMNVMIMGNDYTFLLGLPQIYLNSKDYFAFKNAFFFYSGAQKVSNTATIMKLQSYDGDIKPAIKAKIIAVDEIDSSNVYRFLYSNLGYLAARTLGLDGYAPCSIGYNSASDTVVSYLQPMCDKAQKSEDNQTAVASGGNTVFTAILSDAEYKLVWVQDSVDPCSLGGTGEHTFFRNNVEMQYNLPTALDYYSITNGGYDGDENVDGGVPGSNYGGIEVIDGGGING